MARRFTFGFSNAEKAGMTGLAIGGLGVLGTVLLTWALPALGAAAGLVWGVSAATTTAQAIGFGLGGMALGWIGGKVLRPLAMMLGTAAAAMSGGVSGLLAKAGLDTKDRIKRKRGEGGGRRKRGVSRDRDEDAKIDPSVLSRETRSTLDELTSQEDFEEVAPRDAAPKEEPKPAPQLKQAPKPPTPPGGM